MQQAVADANGAGVGGGKGEAKAEEEVQSLRQENEALRTQARAADKRVAAATAVQVCPAIGRAVHSFVVAALFLPVLKPASPRAPTEQWS